MSDQEQLQKMGLEELLNRIVGRVEWTSDGPKVDQTAATLLRAEIRRRLELLEELQQRREDHGPNGDATTPGFFKPLEHNDPVRVLREQSAEGMPGPGVKIPMPKRGAVAAETERCAKIADAHEDCGEFAHIGRYGCAEAIAAEIRKHVPMPKRGEK